MSTRTCPFCPIMLPDQPELWEQIGPQFFGGAAKIGDVHSCSYCAMVAEGYEQDYLDSLQTKNAPKNEGSVC